MKNSRGLGRLPKRILIITTATLLASVGAALPAQADNRPQSTISGSQLQGTGALPGSTSVDISVSPFITDGSRAPFNPQAAASWAINHAQDPEPFPAGCTYFVTQALFAAGIPQNPNWTLEGSHGTVQTRPGTASATAVVPFIQTLLTTFPASTLRSLSMTENNLPDARLGDLIAYDWDGDGVYDHLAIITGFATDNDQYPVVSEWGIYGGFFSTDEERATQYVQRGWTYSQKNGHWLQSASPNMAAALIHIDTTIPSTY